MSNYRFSAPLLPVFFLLVLPTLAGYPWQMPVGSSLALPLLTLLTILYTGVRYPGLLFSTVVFIGGFLCDLFTHSPLGFWSLLFLLALLCTRAIHLIVPNRNRFILVLCFGLSVALMTAATWGLASLYQFTFKELKTIIEGMVMALLLLPLPILLYIGFERALILKYEDPGGPAQRPSWTQNRR